MKGITKWGENKECRALQLEKKMRICLNDVQFRVKKEEKFSMTSSQREKKNEATKKVYYIEYNNR